MKLKLTELELVAALERIGITDDRRCDAIVPSRAATLPMKWRSWTTKRVKDALVRLCRRRQIRSKKWREGHFQEILRCFEGQNLPPIHSRDRIVLYDNDLKTELFLGSCQNYICLVMGERIVAYI